MNILEKVNKIKMIKEEIRNNLNLAGVLTIPSFHFKGYERQIRRIPEEMVPNFFYHLDENNYVDEVTIIFDEDVSWYGIWYEFNTKSSIQMNYKLYFNGDWNPNLSTINTHWSTPGLLYLESPVEEIVYTGSNPWDFSVKEFKFPNLKKFSFQRNFSPDGTFTLESFPKIEEFSGNVCQNDTSSTFSIIEFPELKTFNGYIIPNNENIGRVSLPKCNYFYGDIGKAEYYDLPSLENLSGPVFNSNTHLREVRLGKLTTMDFSTKFDSVDKNIFRIYVKVGSDITLVERLENQGITVVYY